MVPPRNAGPRVLVAIVVVALLLALWHAGPGHPWVVLRARYPGSLDSRPTGTAQSVELRGGRRFGTFRYRRGVIVTLGASHLWLDMGRRFGFEWLYPPIKVPAAAIATCTPVPHRGSSAVDLWVAETGVGITIPADNEHVLGWCRKAGIAAGP